jgi:hypothetical protein
LQPLVLQTFVVGGRNIGIINSTTQSHLVRYFYNIYLNECVYKLYILKFRNVTKERVIDVISAKYKSTIHCFKRHRETIVTHLKLLNFSLHMNDEQQI